MSLPSAASLDVSLRINYYSPFSAISENKDVTIAKRDINSNVNESGALVSAFTCSADLCAARCEEWVRCWAGSVLAQANSIFAPPTFAFHIPMHRSLVLVLYCRIKKCHRTWVTDEWIFLVCNLNHRTATARRKFASAFGRFVIWRTGNTPFTSDIWYSQVLISTRRCVTCVWACNHVYEEELNILSAQALMPVLILQFVGHQISGT